MSAVDLAKNNAVEVRKIGYRQSKDGMVVSFVLHPDEAPADLATAPIGQRYMMVAVRIGDDEQPVAPEPSPQKQGKKRWHEMPASQRAAILCGDQAFCDWLRANNYAVWVRYDDAPDTAPVDAAAATLRHLCYVHSRAQFDTDEHARKKFERIEEDFQIAAGRVPPPR